MHPDPRDALQRAAAAPDRPLDLDRVYARGRRHGRNRRLAAVTAPVLVFAVIVSTVLAVRPAPHRPPGSPAASGQLDRLAAGWTVLSAPSSMSDPLAAAWTGQRLLVWARTGLPSGETAGFAFDARAGSWRTTADFPLAARELPTWAWTGRQLLVWGGLTYDFGNNVEYDDGAAYDPATDSWRTLPRAPIAARAPLWVWTGRDLIVWGDQVTSESVYDGAAYDDRSGTWRRIADAPVALTQATAAWTGREMIVLGLEKTRDGGVVSGHLAGAAFDPATDSWRRVPVPGLNLPQPVLTAWDGTELIVVSYEGPSAAYDPTRNAWRPLPRAPESGACGPQTPTVGHRVFIPRCVSSATIDTLGVYTYDRAVAGWTDITLADPPLSSGLLVEVGSLLLLVGRTSPAGDSVMYAYRPPG